MSLWPRSDHSLLHAPTLDLGHPLVRAFYPIAIGTCSPPPSDCEPLGPEPSTEPDLGGGQSLFAEQLDEVHEWGG